MSYYENLGLDVFCAILSVSCPVVAKPMLSLPDDKCCIAKVSGGIRSGVQAVQQGLSRLFYLVFVINTSDTN